jgi:hypothetical protein
MGWATFWVDFSQTLPVTLPLEGPFTQSTIFLSSDKI